MATSASNKSGTLAEEAKIRGVSTSGTSQAQAHAQAENLARQVDQGQVPAARQSARQQGRSRRRTGLKKRAGRRRSRATRRR